MDHRDISIITSSYVLFPTVPSAFHVHDAYHSIIFIIIIVTIIVHSLPQLKVLHSIIPNVRFTNLKYRKTNFLITSCDIYSCATVFPERKRNNLLLF